MTTTIHDPNMRFFVFPEFRNLHLLEGVRQAFPEMNVCRYTPDEKSAHVSEVMYINAKLFFPKGSDEVDRVLDALTELGFKVENRRPYTDHKNKHTGKVTRVYFDDRVILSG
jgi:hypothetical protein